jgi:cellulose synthase/poly-beta-1,6-N-acetylglucosamine synthase-like glycosyltransferase
MSTPEVTVVMVPRERYSAILPAIDSLYENTADVAFRFIYVDGCVPEFIRTEVEKKAAERGFEFIHKDYPIAPNEARNLGCQRADTPYVVFTDNDIIYTKGWLQTLLNTAKEYDAWLVGPTILDGPVDTGHIHAAAGRAGFEMIDGKRLYCHYEAANRNDVIHELKDEIEENRGDTTMLEFHVIMVRRDAFDTIGPLDERLLAYADHDDLVLAVANAGGKVIFEPESVVSYMDPVSNPGMLQDYDMEMFLLRWSDDWNVDAIRHFADKWDMDAEDPWPAHGLEWIRRRRRQGYRNLGLYGRLVGFTYYKISKALGRILEGAITRKYTTRLRTIRAQHVPSS